MAQYTTYLHLSREIKNPIAAKNLVNKKGLLYLLIYHLKK